MYMFVRHSWHMSTACRLPLVPHARLAARSPYGTCRLRSSAAWASCVGLSRLPWLACCRSVVSCGPQSTLHRIRARAVECACLSLTCTLLCLWAPTRAYCAPLRCVGEWAALGPVPTCLYPEAEAVYGASFGTLSCTYRCSKKCFTSWSGRKAQQRVPMQSNWL